MGSLGLLLTQPSKRIASALGLLTLAIVVFAVAPTVTQSRSHPLRASFHSCGDLSSVNSYDIQAKRVRCPEAKRVVRAYDSAVQNNGGFTQDVLGFHCKVAGLYGDGGIQRCAAHGHRIVRFLRGG